MRRIPVRRISMHGRCREHFSRLFRTRRCSSIPCCQRKNVTPLPDNRSAGPSYLVRKSMRNTELKHAGNKTQDCDPLGTKQNVQDGMPSIAGRNVVRMLLEHVRCVFVSLQDSLIIRQFQSDCETKALLVLSHFPFSCFFRSHMRFPLTGCASTFWQQAGRPQAAFPFLSGGSLFRRAQRKGAVRDVQLLFWM